MTAARGPIRIAWSLAVLVLGWSVRAAAEDPPEVLDAGALAVRIEAVREGRDARALERLVRAAAEAHNRSRSVVARQRLRAQLAAVLKDPAEDANRLHAVDAFAHLDDARAAWRELRRQVPDPRQDDAGPVGVRVLRALGLLAYEPCLDEVLRYLRQGRDPEAVSTAATALGRYRFSRRREDLLVELLAVGEELEAAPRRTAGADPDELRRRWLRVVDDVVAAMDALTGRRVGRLAAWRDLVAAQRSDLGSLFASDPR